MGLCLCTLGEERVKEMGFSVQFDEIRRQVKQTMEMVRMLESNEEFPDQNFFDVRASLKRIRIQNACLDVEELFNLQRSLNTIYNVVTFLRQCQDEENTIPMFPHLYTLTQEVKTYPQMVKRIDQILDKYGHVKDTASPALLQIRQELAATAGSVSRALQNILKSAKGEGLIDKDVSPTLRDGRLVIPVAPALKRKIRGIVHDESDTGRTVFIEPAEVVEANNKIRELESEERMEIHRILLEFTDTVRPEVEDMLQSYDFLAQIDFIRAKAKFAITTHSTEPRMENRQVIDWAIAVHPLLELKFSKYNTKSDCGVLDNKTRLDYSDDAARQNWGGSWRMPTDAEWTELRSKCTWRLTRQGRHYGYKVTGRNGNSIFLPAAGHRYEGSLRDAGSYGGYWSSSLGSVYPWYAWSVYFNWNVFFNSFGVYRSNLYRCYGYSVRPVTE